MESTLKRKRLPEEMLEQLRNNYVVEWMSTPPLSCLAGTTVEQVVNEFLLPHVANEIPATEPDGTLVGMLYLKDILLQRTPWKELLVREIMRPLKCMRTLKPQQDVKTAIELLSLDEREARAVPVVSNSGKLIGEFRRGEVTNRLEKLMDHVVTLNAMTPIRFSVEKPVLSDNGTRIGRFTRLVVDRKDFTWTHLVLRMDGLTGREIRIPAECVTSWNGDGIHTTLSHTNFANLPDFAPALSDSTESPEAGILRDSVCLDHRTRIWAGADSLGRLTEFELDASGRRLTGIVYATGLGLLFHQHYFLPVEAVVSMTDARIDAISKDSVVDAQARRIHPEAQPQSSASSQAQPTVVEIVETSQLIL